MNFKPWPKITRIEKKRSPIFTEKIDGTNACVVWSYDPPDENTLATGFSPIEINGEQRVLSLWAQSRSRFITPGDDNFGFALWVLNNSENLALLGEGHHYGEWWGQGIQRGYGLDHKKFSLFNTRRWGKFNPNTPACCSVVPTIKNVTTVEEVREYLKQNGSLAMPGWQRPEGAVMYEPDTDTCFKIIIDK